MAFRFQSPCAPVFVPIDGNNNIDFDIIPKYSKYLSENGITSIFVNGGCGEFSSLTVVERKMVLEMWVKVSKPDEEIVVNVGTANYSDTVELANHALQFNIKGLVLIPPYYMPLTNETDLVEYFASIVKALNRPVPILYYHIPMLTKVNIDLGDFVTVVNQQKYNFLSSIKYTDKSIGDLISLMDSIKANQSDITVFCGYEPLLNDALAAGVKGCVLSFVNIMPLKIRSIFECSEDSESRDKDIAVVNNMFNAIVDFGVRYKIQTMALLKMAAEIKSGLPLGPMRPPYVISEHHAALFREFCLEWT